MSSMKKKCDKKGQRNESCIKEFNKKISKP